MPAITVKELSTLIYITSSQPELAKLYNENIGVHHYIFTVPRNESSWKSHMRSKSSTGVKDPWSESSWTFRSKIHGTKVLYVDFLLPGTTVLGNEKSRYCKFGIILV